MQWTLCSRAEYRVEYHRQATQRLKRRAISPRLSTSVEFIYVALIYNFSTEFKLVQEVRAFSDENRSHEGAQQGLHKLHLYCP